MKKTRKQKKEKDTSIKKNKKEWTIQDILYPLLSKIDFQVIIGDITKVEADAIVNAASPFLMGGAGVDGAIHRAAGPELREECATLHGCHVGGAKTTKAYNLPAKYVIHAVGPNYRDYTDDEAKDLLRKTYRSLLKEALDKGVKTLSIPAISCGIYAFPLEDAVKIATRTIYEYRGVPWGVCDGAPMHIDRWGLKNIIFVVSNREIADLYQKEIESLKVEEEYWCKLKNMVSIDYTPLLVEKKDGTTVDIGDINDSVLQRFTDILEKYPHFGTKDGDTILCKVVKIKNPKAIEFIKILLKYGADKNKTVFHMPEAVSYTLVEEATCPEIKEFLMSIGVPETPPKKEKTEPLREPRSYSDHLWELLKMKPKP